MLQRSEWSAGSSSEVSESDKLIGCLEKCAKDVDCISACYGEEEKAEEVADEKVKAGSLVVTAESADDAKVFIGRASDLDILTFKTSEEVEISRITLERYGYSTPDNVYQVWLENEEGAQITEPAELNSKGQAKLAIKKDYRKVDGEMNATIVLLAEGDLDNDGVADNGKTITKPGATFGFKVIDVTSTAEDLDLGNYKPATYEAIAFDGAKVTVTQRKAAKPKTYNFQAGEMYEVAKFKVESPEDSAIKVSGFTLEDMSASLDVKKFLDEVEVTIDGKEVSKLSAEANDSHELAISFKDVEIAAKSRAEVIVKMSLSDDLDKFGDTVEYEVTKLNATDSKVSSRVDANLAWCAGNGVVYVFNGGKIQIDSKNLGNVESFENSTDVLVAEWEITLSQAIKSDKGDVTITVNNTNVTANATTGLKNKQVVKAMRIVVAGDEYEGTWSASGADDVFSFPSIEIDRSSKIKILVDTIEKNGAEGDYVTFTIAGLVGALPAAAGFYYDDNSKAAADMAGSMNISQLNLTPSRATLTNSKANDEEEFKAGKTSAQTTIFKGTYTAKKADINLSEFSLENSTNADWHNTANVPTHKLTAYLYLGGKLVADGELGWDTTNNKWIASDSFSSNKVLVKAGESVDVELKVMIEAAAADNIAAPTNLVNWTKFNLTLQWEDSNGNERSGVATKATAKISIVTAGTPEVEVAKAARTVLLRGAEGAIAEFTVKPSGSSSIDLEKVEFTKPAGVDCADLKLTIGSVDENFAPNGGNCRVSGFVESIAKEGEVLRIEFENEPDYATSLIEAKVEGLVLNNTEVSNKFSKAYADAVLAFTQADNKSETKYTIADLQKYNASAQVTDLHFYNANWDEFVINGLKAGDALTKGDTFTIDNLSNSVRVAKISYTVKRTGYANQVVVIDNDTYPDYFTTTGGEDLRVYANGKESDAGATPNTQAASPIVTVPTSLPAVVQAANWLNVDSIDKVQQNISIDNTTHKITGTLKDLTAYGSVNDSVAVTHVIYIKVDNATAATTTVWITENTPLDADKDIVITVSGTWIPITVKLDGTNAVTYDISGLVLE